MFARSVEDIVRLYGERQKERHPVIARMTRIQQQYNGDVIVPLPELDKDEQSFVANMVTSGIDNYGMRVASVMPNLTCPPINPRSKPSMDKAAIRRQAYLGWWEQNKLQIKLRRRARHFVGYACSPVVVLPDFKKGIPRWEMRNPLSAYPAKSTDPDCLTPDDVIFATRWSAGALRRTWPDKLAGLVDRDTLDGAMFEVLEYMDGEQIMMIAHGENTWNHQHRAVALDSITNRTGVCPAVIPGRVTLDRASGQFDGILGMYQMQAKMMALEVHAVAKGVYPDTYLISRPNEQASFISGPHPGYTGEVNVVEGGDIREVQINPSFAATQIGDRLERAQRVQAGIPAEFGGESGTNIRTGRRGDAVLSAVVDYPIQEAQDLFAASMEEENRRACAVARTWFGDKAQSFYVKWRGAAGRVDYVPSRDFETDHNIVTYAMAGADTNNLIIALGQRVGTGMMSKDTARRLDPYVQDPDLEGDAVMAEALEQSLLASLQNQAASGQLPPADLARITDLVYTQNVTLADAVLQAQREAQERQATSGPPGTPTGPVDPASPEAQPGLAPPGVGAEQASIPEPEPSMQNLEQMLQTLRAG